MTFGRIYDTRSFEFSVKTDNLRAGSSTNTQYRLPITGNFIPFNIEWGDGTFNFITAFNDPNLLHQYPVAGTYPIKVKGLISGLQFNQNNDRNKLMVISKVDGLIISNAQTFDQCSNMTWTATESPIITTSSFQLMFRSCINFNGNIGNWNTSSVTNMTTMFGGCTNFNQNIGSWNTSSVTDMQSMFLSCTNFNQNIGSWNTSNVTNMLSMFIFCTNFNQNIGSWNISKVTNFTNFMAGKTALNFSAVNLDAIYNGWSSRPVKTPININFNTIKYTAASSAGRAILTDAPNNWVITDGGI